MLDMLTAGSRGIVVFGPPGSSSDKNRAAIACNCGRREQREAVRTALMMSLVKLI